MTDVLDRPAVLPRPASPALRRPAPPRAVPAPVDWAIVALLVGAGVIHLAMAPSHLGESALEGSGFLVAAWVQVGLAVAVLVRPARWVLGAVVASSLALVAAWAVSRTAGLPFGAHAGHAESASVVDGAAVGLEVAAALLAGALLVRPIVRGLPRAPALVAVLAALGLTTGVLASPAARDHAAASHGDHGAEATAAAGGGGVAAGHDHGGGAAAPAGAAGPTDHDGGSGADAADGPTTLDGRHVHGVKADDIAAEALPNEPLDPLTRAVLADQLVQARETAMRHPTVADAEAAGLILAGGFAPGSGAHYISMGGGLGGGDFDPTRPNAWIYDGTSPTSQIVGLMYYDMSAGSPEGFAGPNDHWHRHSGVCIRFGSDGIEVPLPSDADITRAQCAAVDGTFMDVTGWMVHAWVVPSWESPLGVFSHDNPDVRCADGTYDTDDAGFCEGT